MESTRPRPLLHEPLVQIRQPDERYRSLEGEPDDGVLHKLISFSRWEAWKIVGGLANPSKMPCYSWGIPASTCQIGSKLAKIEGSVCKECYALKGYFRYQKVGNAYQRRLDRFDAKDPRWIKAMVKLIYWQTVETGSPYFRWFCSGDLQSVEMLQAITEVARRTPEIRHWLPTREYRLVECFLLREPFPENLLVRLSAHMIDGSPPRQFDLPTSTVHSTAAEMHGAACSAYESKPANCGTCRACWDRRVQNVSYPMH